MRPDTLFHRGWARRIGWLVLIWMAGVATLAIVATVVRMLMHLAGMTT